MALGSITAGLLSTNPMPRFPPSPGSRNVLVIGAGVSGLTTAWALLDRGFRVKIVAREWPTIDGPHITSQISGALWEYPPAVCGHHEIAPSFGKAAEWSMISYHFLHLLASDPVTARDYGVKMRKTVFFFKHPINKDALQQQKMSDIRRSGVIDFRHDAHALLQEYDVPNHYVDAYSMQAPVIDTDKALAQMLYLVKRKGAELITASIDTIDDGGRRLCQEFQVDAVVNATGLGAREVAADDQMYALRGAVIRLQNDGSEFTKIEDALVVSAVGVEEDHDSSFIFIVPRNNNIVILGGFSQPNNEEKITSINDPLLQNLRSRCNDFLHSRHLQSGQVDHAYSYAQGLRPGRRGDVRVEREQFVVHNYGHAGSGWSLSIGCALEVAGLVEDVCSDMYHI